MDWNVQITTLNNKHSALVNTEKERAMQVCMYCEYVQWYICM